MSRPATQFSSIVLGCVLEAPCSRVYALLSDPDERQRLAEAYGDVTMVLDEIDFRVGGHEMLRFGPHRQLRFHVHSTYQDIVAERRIVSTDVVYEQDIRLSVSTTTLELDAIGARTRLKLAAQLVLLGDDTANDDAGLRYQALIDGLGHLLDGSPRGQLRSIAMD